MIITKNIKIQYRIRYTFPQKFLKILDIATLRLCVKLYDKSVGKLHFPLQAQLITKSSFTSLTNYEII